MRPGKITPSTSMAFCTALALSCAIAGPLTATDPSRKISVGETIVPRSAYVCANAGRAIAHEMTRAHSRTGVFIRYWSIRPRVCDRSAEAFALRMQKHKKLIFFFVSARSARAGPLQHDQERSVIGRHRLVDDARLDDSPARRRSNEHVIDAQPGPPARADRRRIGGGWIGPAFLQYVHDRRIRTGVHVSGQDRRLIVLVNQSLVEVP